MWFCWRHCHRRDTMLIGIIVLIFCSNVRYWIEIRYTLGPWYTCLIFNPGWGYYFAKLIQQWERIAWQYLFTCIFRTCLKLNGSASVHRNDIWNQVGNNFNRLHGLEWSLPTAMVILIQWYLKRKSEILVKNF